MKKSTLFLLFAVLLAAFGVAAPARAQDATPTPTPAPFLPPPDVPEIEPTRLVIEPVPLEPPVHCIDCPPVPPVWRVEGLEIPYQRVNVTIEDQVATTHVEQLFRNPNDWALEGTYFFPLPPGAAVSQLTMWVDGAPIEAKILDKAEARGIYDEIVRQMRDPALLEYVGNDAVQANVFPIPPGGERKVEIEYQQVLAADNGAFRYVFPQSAGLYTQTPLDEQSIRVELRSGEAIRAIYSPTHPVAISREGEFNAVAGYEGADVTPDSDFALYYTVSPEQIGLNLLSYKQPGEDGFFLLLVAPGIEPGEVAAKDVILVMDTSGSMEGEKLGQTKAAARYVVEHLNPEDRFAIVSFSTGVSLFEPALLPANQPGGYAQYIDSLEAVGGTNISEALLEAASLVDPERPTTILFLTDGLATEGITDTSLLLQSVDGAMPDNARVFAFGVGYDVDTTLLDTLSQDQRGVSTYVAPGEAVDETVSGFYAKVSSPVLTDISLDMGGVRVDQVYPVDLPDLFAGTQLVVAGRYREGGPATVTLRGTTNGREQVFSYPDQTFADDGGQDFIPRLWATRAVGHMMQQIRLRGEDPELVQSIVNLSKRYGIITPYTSFLIEENDIYAQTGQPAIGALSAPADASGAEAVERAAAEGEMAAAEAPAAMPTMAPAGTTTPGAIASAGVAVREASGRAFYYRGGVWVDGAYDPTTGEPQLVPAFSDAYFNLLAERPELGEALALGDEVITVVDGIAYHFSAAAAGAETGTAMPAVEDPSPAAATPMSGIGANENFSSTPEVTPTAQGQTSAGIQVCGLGLLLPLALVVGFGMNRASHKERKEGEGR